MEKINKQKELKKKIDEFFKKVKIDESKIKWLN